MGLLDGCRILDLSDDKGFLCGRILGDFGADVIKIEPPGGDLSRMIGPFCDDVPHSSRSLYWFAYNANKRGITLDIESSEGQAIFKKLVETADCLVESFSPGAMAGMGLGYDALRRTNPRLVMTSITSFGQSGPWRDYRGSDITLWALSSYMYVTGDEDRPPVRPTCPQAFLHAGLEAAAASLVALYSSRLTGMGQWVDVSTHDALAIVNLQNQQYWDLARFSPRRAGSAQVVSGVRWSTQRRLWRCRDGFVVFIISSGHIGAQANRALTEWLDSEGMVPEFMRDLDWDSFNPQGHELTDEQHGEMMAAIGSFFERHTKTELYRGSIERRIVLYPCNTTEDLMNSDQLKARDFWAEIAHDELGDSLLYPRPCMAFSEASCKIRRRAPVVGEHNQEVYAELGLSRDNLRRLHSKGVI